MFANFSQWWDTLGSLLKALYCIAFPSTLLLIIQTILAMFGMHNGGMGHDMSDTSGLDMHTDLGGHGFGGHDIGGVGHDIGFHHDVGLHHDLGLHHDVGIHHDVSDLSGHGQADIHNGDMHSSVDGGDPGDFTTMHFFTLQTIVTFLTVFSWSAIVLVSSKVPAVLAMVIGMSLGLATMIAVAKMVQLSSRLAENGTINLHNALGETATVYIPCPPRNEGMGKVTLTVQGQLTEVRAFNNGDDILKTGTIVRVVDVRGDDVVVEREA
ncbi:MAG: hypothetical protein IJ806_09375 [Ruminococcus sp.]|nr:hypothetical protein [Ruminococcus sp.]